MGQLEEEQNQSRDLLKEFGFFKEFAQNSQERLIAEKTHHQENYQVIANVMQNLKSPVNSVMDNLANLIDEIGDVETQESLRECMNTAGHVLRSFTEVEEFCLEEAKEVETTSETLPLRDFFKTSSSNCETAPPTPYPTRSNSKWMPAYPWKALSTL